MHKDNENCRYSGTTPETTGRQEEIAEGIYSLSFAVSKSIRYHSKRRRFFENIHNWSDAISAISGSSAFAALLSGDKEHIAVWLSAIVAIFTSCDLVIGYAKKARQHNDLQKRFSRLSSDIIIGHHTAKNLALWKAERISIEKDEPTPLTLLATICHNEEAIAIGHHDRVIKGIGWRGKFSNWFLFDDFHQRLLIKRHSALKEEIE